MTMNSKELMEAGESYGMRSKCTKHFWELILGNDGLPGWVGGGMAKLLPMTDTNADKVQKIDGCGEVVRAEGRKRSEDLVRVDSELWYLF